MQWQDWDGLIPRDGESNSCLIRPPQELRRRWNSSLCWLLYARLPFGSPSHSSPDHGPSRPRRSSAELSPRRPSRAQRRRPGPRWRNHSCSERRGRPYASCGCAGHFDRAGDAARPCRCGPPAQARRPGPAARGAPPRQHEAPRGPAQGERGQPQAPAVGEWYARLPCTRPRQRSSIV